MTISSTVRIAGPYIGNGTATVFSFAFKVFTATNLQVVRVDTSTGLESTLVLTTDYTVSLNADQDSNPGGNVTLLAVLATGFNMIITSDIANLQPTDLTNQGGFYPEVITDALDRATIQIQQMADELTRSIKIPVTDGLSLDMELPTAAVRANSFLAFDATGEPTVVTAGSSNAPTTITRQQFSGTGSQVAYTLASDPGALGNSCEVFVGGIYQQRDTYTIAGTTLTFTAAPVAGTDNIEVVNFLTTAIGTTDSSLVTYVPAGTSATQRTVQAKLRDTVSVKDFGAVGDGVTDDRAAIQAAINTNKEVFVPNGTYNLSASLTMTLNQQIRGESQTLAILKTTAAVNAITVADSAYCKISNLYINGNSIGLAGIKVGLGTTFSAFHTIEFCDIKNFTSYGIHLNGTSYVMVDNCFIRDNGGNGIYNNLGSPSGYGNANTISNCQIWDCGTYGIHFYRASNNIIENTKFVLATGGTSLTVGNRISNIYINNSHSTTIDKCEFENVDSGYTTYNILIDDLDSPAALPNTISNKIRECRFVGYLLNCSYNVALGLVGNVYNTEIASTTFVRAVNEDVYLGQYANNTVIDDCEHRFTYDTPLLGENATVYNPYSMLYTLFEFGNQSRGSFTPIFQTSTGGTNWSSTYNSNIGYYTKIQNVVHFSLGISVNAITTSGTGALIITGLPFQCWDNGVPTSLAISGLLNLTTPATYNVNVRARLRRATYADRSITNSTVIELYYGASNDIALPSAQLNNGHYMVLSGSYLTNVI